MLNWIILVSTALFGVSAGAVLGTRARVGRRFPATPGLADIAVLAVLFTGAAIQHWRVWGLWLHFAGWVGLCIVCGTVAQWVKPTPRLTHELTQ